MQTTHQILQYREVSTILAALRILQANPEYADGMSHFLDCDPLSSNEIDTLCEKITFSQWRA